MRAAPLALALLGCAPDAALEARVAKLEAEVADLRERVVDKRLEQERAVVGKDAILQGDWVQGQTSLDAHRATVLVFWEPWCPHCKREVPKLEGVYQRFREQGLGVVGVSQMTRGTTPEKFQHFVDEHGLSFPLLKDDGTLGKHYAVSGVPAAAIVRDGKVVWRGNPAKLDDAAFAAAVQ